jgi:branched-chain amino acid transport system ATP-binding protein
VSAETEPRPVAREEPLLRVRHLGTAYGDLQVVWDVSVDVWPATITALLGRNGAGKTSALRAITGLNRLTGGEVAFRGQDISRAKAHARVRSGIAFVQEGKRVFRKLSVEQNLLVGGYPIRKRRTHVRANLEHTYDLFPVLAEKRRSPAASLSGGQQQMLAIGQALMAEPSLLVLDEPSGGLAPVVMKEVMEKVGELRQTGLGVLLVEQAVEAVLEIADHVVVLDLGRELYSASRAEIGDGAALRDAYFGRTAGKERP